MGNSDSTVEANYDPREYTITLNANGGFVNDKSEENMTVIYDSTYGTLPTPKREGYNFIGWYTSQTGGEEVKAGSKVIITNNQTLYARWNMNVTETMKKLAQVHAGSNPDFSQAAESDEGVFTMADNYGTSYYFRGAVENNYVKFGKWSINTPDIYYGYSSGRMVKEFLSQQECENDSTYNNYCILNHRAGKDMYWRIVRINGDGTLRIIYDGTDAYTTNDYNGDRYVASNIQYNHYKNNAKYVGYMYGGKEGDASTSIDLAFKNDNESAMKIFLESWYETHLLNYTNAIADSSFCNDRTYYISDGNVIFNATDRLNINYAPSFICSQEADIFTTQNSKYGNKLLKYPIGLLTGDEASAAGGVWSISNNKYYLMKNVNYWYTMTPKSFHSGGADIFRIFEYGMIHGAYTNYEIGSVVPVINLTAKYANSLVGDGSINNPYQEKVINP